MSISNTQSRPKDAGRTHTMPQEGGGWEPHPRTTPHHKEGGSKPPHHTTPHHSTAQHRDRRGTIGRGEGGGVGRTGIIFIFRYICIYLYNFMERERESKQERFFFQNISTSYMLAASVCAYAFTSMKKSSLKLRPGARGMCHNNASLRLVRHSPAGPILEELPWARARNLVSMDCDDQSGACDNNRRIRHFAPETERVFGICSRVPTVPRSRKTIQSQLVSCLSYFNCSFRIVRATP